MRRGARLRGGRRASPERLKMTTDRRRMRFIRDDTSNYAHVLGPQAGNEHRESYRQAILRLIEGEMDFALPQITLDFRRVLAGLEIVGDGDDRQQNRRQHQQRNQLHADSRKQ